MRKPIDIKRDYGDRYKVTLDEAARHEVNGRNNPWYYQIPCKVGNIYPYSSKLLAFYCEGTGIKARLLREQKNIKLIQDGDIEGVFLFTPDQFDIIAQYAKPRKRRRLSPEQRERLIEAGKGNLKNRKKTGVNHIVDSQTKDSGVSGMEG